MTKKLRENQIFILIPTHRHIWKESLCRLPLNALCNFVELRDWIPKGHSISYTLLPCHWNSHVECRKPEGQILETTWKPQEKSSLFCSSVTQLCPTLCDPLDCSTPGFPVLHHLPELAQTHVHWPSNHLVLCHSLFLLPSIFPSIRVFSNESALCIRWPKYRSFIFSIRASSEFQGWLVTFF